MADNFHKFPVASQNFQGYISNPANAQPNYLSFPCQNMLVTEDGKVEQRKGYQTEFEIGVDGSSATTFYHSTYDIAFFALGTKVYYRDFNTNTTVDTGITLTDGTTTRITEFFGDVYLTNTTDSMVRICVGRLNDSAANAGDSTFTVDLSFLGRMTAFGDTSGNFRINGTDESVASFVLATGVCTHSSTLSQSYDDNSIVIFTETSSAPSDKPSKILFWKSRMHIMGFPSATNADQPNNTVLTGQFVSGAATASGDATDIENIVDFTFGTGGSTKITVGGGGAVTNILGVADTIYFFTENRVFNTASSSIADSGSAIGFTLPDEKDSLHGCLNEDSATVMGSSAVTYITNDNRIMRIPVDTDTGAAIARPEEDYDVDIRSILRKMDKNQSGALVYHWKGGRQTIYQIKVSGQWIWLIFDQNIVRRMGSNFVRGAWQPPQSIAPVKGFFERNGVLYGTDISDDKVYKYFTNLTDDLATIYPVFATGDFNVGNAKTKNCQMAGEINNVAKIKIKCFVVNKKGKKSGSAKVINGEDYDAGNFIGVGATPVGGGIGGGEIMAAKWDREFGVFPSQGTRAQIIATNEEEGGWFSVTSFALDGDQYPRSFSKRL